jgi:hypothetical protein
VSEQRYQPLHGWQLAALSTVAGGAAFGVSAAAEKYLNVPSSAGLPISFILGFQAGRIAFEWWLRRQRK